MGGEQIEIGSCWGSRLHAGVGWGEPLKSSRNLECEGLLGLNEYDLTAKEGNFENAQQWGDKI